MAARRKRAPKLPKFYIESSILAILLISAAFVFDSIMPQAPIPTAIPVPSPAKAIFDGTGPVPPFNLKYLDPLEAGTYKVSLLSDYPVGMIMFPSFQDLLNFAQMKEASFYNGCIAEDTTGVTLECAVLGGAFIAVYNPGSQTASVSLTVDEIEATHITGFVVKKLISVVTSRHSFNVEALR